MNCYIHTDQAAVAFCRTCGRGLCQACQRVTQGTVFCAEHVPAPVAPPPAPAYAAANVSPGLAFVLGLIPGVGAIYNGQYVKGILHVVIFGVLISIVSSGTAGGMEPLFGLLIGGWFFYMAFEGYHTASKRQRGEPVDEFSSLFPLKNYKSGFPAGPVLLIAAGVIFLLDTLGVIRIYQIMRYWPVFLIALGGYMLYVRLLGQPKTVPAGGEAPEERQ